MSEKKENDMVNHPKHYNVGKYEVIDVIEDWKLDFHIGNAVKYLGRAGHKSDEIEDLKKATWYINRKIELLKKDNKSSRSQKYTIIIDKDDKEELREELLKEICYSAMKIIENGGTTKLWEKYDDISFNIEFM